MVYEYFLNPLYSSVLHGFSVSCFTGAVLWSGRLGARALSSLSHTDPQSDCQCQLLVSVCRCARASAARSSALPIDPRLSPWHLLLRQDLSIDKPGVQCSFPPK